MFKGLNIIEFFERFRADEICRNTFRDKWENGYQCGKCGYNGYYEIKKIGSWQCVNCKYEESATARTLFHKVKFSLRKVFYIVFMVVTNKKGMSSYELSRKLGLRQKTCWSFKQKVIEAMKSGGNNPLMGDIEVYEFYVDGP